MNLVYTSYVVAGLAIIVIILKPLFASAKSVDLANNFKKVGSFNGKSLDEIVKLVGKPSVVESANDGKLISWNSKNYAIKLKFDSNNNFVSKVEEVAKN